MLRMVRFLVAVALGSFVSASGATAQEVCPPVDETSEPDENDPAIISLRWPAARDVLVESGFVVEVLPAGLGDGIENLASVVGWGVDTPGDDVNPLVAVVCLGRPVPDVLGSTESAAEAALAAVGFGVIATEGGGEQRLVVEQSPTAGTLLYLGTPVQIVLADPRVRRPRPDRVVASGRRGRPRRVGPGARRRRRRGRSSDRWSGPACRRAGRARSVSEHPHRAGRADTHRRNDRHELDHQAHRHRRPGDDNRRHDGSVDDPFGDLGHAAVAHRSDRHGRRRAWRGRCTPASLPVASPHHDGYHPRPSNVVRRG